jgi:hypothetical protein
MATGQEIKSLLLLQLNGIGLAGNFNCLFWLLQTQQSSRNALRQPWKERNSKPNQHCLHPELHTDQASNYVHLFWALQYSGAQPL